MSTVHLLYFASLRDAAGAGGEAWTTEAIDLRALYVERSAYPEQLAGVVAQVAAPLRTSAASLAELEGKRVGSPKEALADFVRGLGEPGWDVVLSRLSAARETRTLPPEAAAETVMRLIELTRRMRARAVALA